LLSPQRTELAQVVAVLELVKKELAAWVILTQAEPPAAPQVQVAVGERAALPAGAVLGLLRAARTLR